MLRGAFRYYSLFSKKKNFQSDKSIKHILYLKTLIVLNFVFRTVEVFLFSEGEHLKRPVSMLLTVLMVMSLFVSLPAAEIVYAEDNDVPAGGRVITWSGTTGVAMHDRDNYVDDPSTTDGITVQYTGGKKNMLSGLYNDYNVDTAVFTKHLLFNSSDSALKFTSATDNCFITKIVINYDKMGVQGELGAIDVNHNVWTNTDVEDSNGKHILTITGPAARSVTLRNHYSSFM